MTIEEALALLEQHNIHRGISDTARLMLHHVDGRWEHIGEICTAPEAMYIADYIPSQLGVFYNDVRKSIIILDSPRADIRLQAILDDLPTSAQRYEESLRKERIRNLRKYFSERDMKIKNIDLPDYDTLYLR